MSINPEDFRVHEGEDVDLDRRPTMVEPVYESRDEYRKLLRRHVKKLSKLQYNLYASDTAALLVIFQAMDAAGKDGAIKHVMSGVNPQGCQVYSFKHPSAQELDHDFLWRSSQVLPERGRIGIFNRSYYEEVLIVRVHPELLEAERLPEDELRDRDVWKQRYRSILDYERHLTRSGTKVIKFFLHISREEQRRRFLARIDEPEKNWKFNLDDVAERGHWDDYMKAYERCLSATSTKDSPWFIVPADDKKNARLIVSQAIVRALEGMHLELPALTDERKGELASIRGRLEAEAPST